MAPRQDPTTGPLFLQRQRYQMRRLGDAARVLPVAGAVLIYVPLLWPLGEGGDPVPTVGAGVYLFAVWLVTILAAAALARPLMRVQRDQTPQKDDSDAGV